MLKDRWRRTIKKGLLFCAFLSFPALFAEVTEDVLERFEETDINGILLSTKKLDIYSSGSFFVFLGLDADNRLLCEPLSGARKVYSMNPSCLLKTGYWKDTPYYEVYLDALKYFSMSTFWKTRKSAQAEFKWRCNLIRVLGSQKYLTPMMKLQEYGNQCRNDLYSALRELKGLKQERRMDPDGFDDNDVAELAESVIKKTDSTLTSSLNLVYDALNNNDILLASALYFNLWNLWGETVSIRHNLEYQSEYFMKPLDTSFRKAMSKTCDDICAGIEPRLQNQAHKKDFLALFPNARGQWSEAAPSGHEQLQSFFTRFHKARMEMRSYSSLTEFENWGNCCMTVMLCTQGITDANYLDQQFREALKKYKTLFVEKTKN